MVLGPMFFLSVFMCLTSIVLVQPLRALRFALLDPWHLWVSGTPADCVESGQCLGIDWALVAKNSDLALMARTCYAIEAAVAKDWMNWYWQLLRFELFICIAMSRWYRFCIILKGIASTNSTKAGNWSRMYCWQCWIKRESRSVFLQSTFPLLSAFNHHSSLPEHTEPAASKIIESLWPWGQIDNPFLNVPTALLCLTFFVTYILIIPKPREIGQWIFQFMTGSSTTAESIMHQNHYSN